MKKLIWLITPTLWGQLIDYNTQLKNKPELDVRSTKYNFSLTSSQYSVSPSLATTGLKTLTIASPYKCPYGVEGTNSNHYIYISGGVGTAEAVLITGGTCTSNGTGTLQFTTANTHTGSVTVSSATAGIQEAIWIATSNATERGNVYIPAGTHTIHQTITYAGSSLTVWGAGPGITTIKQTNATANWFTYTGGHSNKIGNLQLYSDYVDGVTFRSTKTGGWGIYHSNTTRFTIDDVLITNTYGGVQAYNTSEDYTNKLKVQTVYDTGGIALLYDGITSGGAEHSLTNSLFSNYPTPVGGTSAAVVIKTGGGYNIDKVTEVGFYIGLSITPEATQVAHWGFVNQSNFDTNGLHGIAIVPTGGIVAGWVFVNTWASSNKDNGIYADSGGGGSIDGLHFSGGSRAYTNGKYGVVIAGANTRNVSLGDFYSCGNSDDPEAVHDSTPTPANPDPNWGLYDGIVVNGASRVGILGGISGTCDSKTTVTQRHGVSILGGVDYYHIGGGIDLVGNGYSGSSGLSLSDAGTGLNRTIGEIVRPVADLHVTLASAAALTLSATDNDTSIITGSTTITTMSPVWYGRKHRLIFTDASPGGVGTGGGGNTAFASAVSVTTNGRIDCEYIGTGWYCK